MKRVAVKIAKAGLNCLYRPLCKKRRENEVVLLSRQTNKPSYDFQQIAKAFEDEGWKTHLHLKKVTKRNMPAYCIHVVKEIKLLGRCKLAILDRYDPVVSLLDFECAKRPPSSAANAGKATGRKKPVNLDDPVKPVVIQIWHAFGAFKKFGHQSVDTAEGHSSSFTDIFSIHRNYSRVLCSGAAARDAFAEAFSCPPERVIPMDRPEYDELKRLACERRERKADGEEFKVLMAPTLRKSTDSAHPFRDLYQNRAQFEHDLESASVSWAFHPLETGLPAPGNVSEKLLECDLLVTDYSSIVYEAFLLDIPTLFYIPDIEAYRLSPGLNIDPLTHVPELCALDEQSLATLIASFANAEGKPGAQALDSFMEGYFDIGEPRDGSAAQRFVQFAIRCVQGSDS